MAETGPADKAAESLRKLWLALSIMALIVCIAVYDVTQGSGGLVLGVKGVIGFGFADGMPEAIAAFWGAMLLPIFMCAACAVLIVHARGHGTDWASRYPFRLFDTPPGSSTGRVAQVVAILVFLLLPIGMIGHSWRVFINFAALCVRGADGTWAPQPLSDWQLFQPAATGQAVRLGHVDGQSVAGLGERICAGGRTIDYYLPVETYLMAGLSILAVVLAGWGVFEIVRRRPEFVPLGSAEPDETDTDG